MLLAIGVLVTSLLTAAQMFATCTTRRITMRFRTWRLGNYSRVSAAVTAALIAVFTTSITPALAEPCAHLSGYPYAHCSTSFQGRKAISDYWNSLTERQKYLTRFANNAVEEFVQRTGRFPTPQLDRSWAQAVAQKAVDSM